MRELFLLDPDVVFLNHGSFGACPAPVFEAYQRFHRQLERRPVEFMMRDFRIDHPDPARLTRLLYDEHRIEVPVVESPAGWTLRASVQAYNDASDLEALAGALDSLSQ